MNSVICFSETQVRGVLEGHFAEQIFCSILFCIIYVLVLLQIQYQLFCLFKQKSTLLLYLNFREQETLQQVNCAAAALFKHFMNPTLPQHPPVGSESEFPSGEFIIVAPQLLSVLVGVRLRGMTSSESDTKCQLWTCSVFTLTNLV